MQAFFFRFFWQFCQISPRGEKPGTPRKIKAHGGALWEQGSNGRERTRRTAEETLKNL